MKISIELFMTFLCVVSVLTSLFTEAVKKVLEEKKKSYSTNLLVGIVAFIIAVIVAVGYCLFFSVTINIQVVIFFIMLAVFSWLCAMIGYDKVIQTLKQLLVK